MVDLEELISKKICKFLLENDTESDEEIILYGVQLVIETVIKYCLLLLLSIIVNQVLACVIYIVLLSGLRANAGGAHSKTNLGCCFILFFVFFVGMLMNKVNIPNVATLIISTIVAVTFVKDAPAFPQVVQSIERRVIIKKKIKSLIWLTASVATALYSNYTGYVVSLMISVLLAVWFSKDSVKYTVKLGGLMMKKKQV